MMRRRPAATVAAAALLTAAVLCTGCGGRDETLLGTLERDRVELVAEAQQTIIEIAVREGDSVAQGQLLLRLDASDAEARLERARSNAMQTERRHAELVAGARREQVREARALAQGATARAATETSEFARVEKLVAERMLPANALDRQRALKDGALSEERAARERLLELERGTRSEVIEQAAAALAAARAEVSELQLSVGRHAVHAPRAGFIDALPYELGERPPQGAPVIVMLAAGQPFARVFIPEPRRASVAAGTAATVRMDGSDRAWKAEIRYVSSEAAFTPYYSLNERDRGRLAFLAEIVLTEPEAQKLPTGIPVEVQLPEPGTGQ